MGGMNYTAVESTKMATAEIFGKTLVELGERTPVWWPSPQTLPNPPRSATL